MEKRAALIKEARLLKEGGLILDLILDNPRLYPYSNKPGYEPSKTDILNVIRPEVDRIDKMYSPENVKNLEIYRTKIAESIEKKNKKEFKDLEDCFE